MNRHDKRLVRLAVQLHDQLQSRSIQAERVTLPSAAWQRCESLHRRLRLADSQGWQHSSRRTIGELRTGLAQLQAELTQADHALANVQPKAMIQSPSDIYRDLMAIREEFDNVIYERFEQFLSVTTEPIELEDIYLGEFEIRLDLNNLSTGQPLSYRVIALDPHPSVPNDSVTHPHVQDESLCEGEGHHAIRHALQQGRLLDFFVIVANLLRTYNVGSPFVALAAWNGMNCSDCDSSMSDDEQHICEKCDVTICDECYSTCHDCGYAYCSECIVSCEDCYQSHCNACLSVCGRCQTETCRACLDDNQRCTHCHDQANEDDCEENTDDRKFPVASPGFLEVQPDSVGQTPVSA